MNGKHSFSLGRTVAALFALACLFLVGVAAGGAIGHRASPAHAQEDEDDSGGYCENDACVKNVRRFWFDDTGCRSSRDSELNCDVLHDGGEGCRNVKC